MSQITVNTQFNSERIEQQVFIHNDFDYRQHISSTVIDLKEAGVKEALIKLGWTPPKSNTA